MKFIYFLLLLCIAGGCAQKNKIPAGILSQQKMRLVLWDMIRADEYANSFLTANDSVSIDDQKAVIYEQIFKLHSTKADIFKKSLTFYQSNPNLLKVVIDSLRSDERRVLQEQYNTNNPVPDTLNQVPDTLIPGKPNFKSAQVD